VIVRLFPLCQLASACLIWLSLSSVSGQIPDEKLEHRSSLGLQFVSVPGTPVLVATHETRLSDWEAFLSASGYEWNYKPHFDQAPDHPVVGITLEDARTFCTWLTDKERAEGRLNSSQGYRLPTLSDWDSAIGLLRMRRLDLSVEQKVADERMFPWGMDWPPPAKVANFAEGEIPGHEDGYPFTAPVGQFKPSAEGIYDLAGNVWEWCWEPEIRAEQVGVLRGGSWAYFRAECLRSSYLYTVPVNMRMPTIGFRCVYEDKQRTAAMLASAEKIKAEIRAQRREEMLGAAVNPEEVEAMKAQLAAANSPVTTSQPMDLKPAQAGQRFINPLGMEFAPLPQSSLLFGSTEVRVQDFETWLKDTGRTWNKPPFLLNGTHPAVGVSWDDASAFCDWLTERGHVDKWIPPAAKYRLPTDLEWSLAAGLPEEAGADPAERHQNAGLHFPWSAQGGFPPPLSSTNLDASRIEGYQDNHAYTAPVTAEATNAQGIHGLGGNASEWCQDVWPGAEEERVIRGGSWLSRDKDLLRTGTRQHAARDSSNNAIGFRVVLDLPAP